MIPPNTQRKSLHFKLLRVVGYALVLAITLSGVAFTIFGLHNEQKNDVQKLTVIGSILAEKTAFELSLGRDYAYEVIDTLSVARHHEDFARVCLYDAQYALYASFLANGITQKCAETWSQKIENRPVLENNRSSRVVLPVLLETETIGYIVVESKGDDLENAMAVLFSAIFGSLFFAVILAFYFSDRQVQHSLIPLKALRNIGLRIASNPYSIERAKKVDNDEVGDLVDAFNTMLDALHTENQKLHSSENTFRSLAENAPVGVFLRKSPRNFDYVNAAWKEITGLSREQTSKFSSLISREYQREYIDALDQLNSERAFVRTEFEFLHNSGEYRFLQEYVSIVKEPDNTYYIGTLVDVTQLKNTQVELEKLAYYDPLTKLPNRRFLNDHLDFTFAAAQKKHKRIAVFMTDLDNFKRVNDTLGHATGDILLEKVASRLRDSVFREDVVARMGGDEFLILVEDIENINNIEVICQHLLDAMRTEAEHEFGHIPVSGSIGVAMYPEDATSPEELLRYADLALYNSKGNGGDQFSCYSAELDHSIREKIHIEQKLRYAIDNNLIEVFLQPQYHAKTQKACWAEALVRWFDAEEGFISPVKFIPIAEDSGLIHALGEMVLDKVCKTLTTYKRELKELNIEGISVNLSAKQFFSDALENNIKSTFEKYQIDAASVEFELTESTVTDDMDRAVMIMQRIRALGCRLSIDDFGTGYSSLSYLKKFPITSLKIDQSFVRDIPENNNDCEIACAIINLAHNLGLTVVAEGVETVAQATFLADKGCEFLQGYYLSRPISVQELLLLAPKHKQHETTRNKTSKNG